MYIQKTTPGYIICIATTGSNLIPNASHIEVDGENPLFYSDYDAARQAEKDGIAIIHDMPGIEDWTYLDTPENRKIITSWLNAQVGEAAIDWANKAIGHFNAMLQEIHGKDVGLQFKYLIDRNCSIRYYYASDTAGIFCDERFPDIQAAYNHANKFIRGG